MSLGHSGWQVSGRTFHGARPNSNPNKNKFGPCLWGASGLVWLGRYVSAVSTQLLTCQTFGSLMWWALHIGILVCRCKMVRHKYMPFLSWGCSPFATGRNQPKLHLCHLHDLSLRAMGHRGTAARPSGTRRERARWMGFNSNCSDGRHFPGACGGWGLVSPIGNASSRYSSRVSVRGLLVSYKGNTFYLISWGYWFLLFFERKKLIWKGSKCCRNRHIK